MRKTVKLLAINACFLASFGASTCIAQDCNAILQHGLRNVSISKSQEARIATTYYNNCGVDYKSMSDSQLASVEVSVFGYGSGSGGYSRTQREDRLNQWCTTNKASAESHKIHYQEAQDIYAPAVAAWDSCNKLASNSVQIVPLITPDDRTVDIKLKYTGPTSNQVTLQRIVQEGFVCDYSNERGQQVSLPVRLSPILLNIHCKRNPAAAVTRSGTLFSKFERGTISVPTATETVQLYFPERWDPELPQAEAQRLRSEIEILKQGSPPGIVAAYAGDALPTGWLWCNGDTLSRSGSYEALFRVIGDKYGQGDGKTTFQLPDYRGKFLRGLDRDGAGGRSKVDADRIEANKGLGSPQDDEIKSHFHEAHRAKVSELASGHPEWEEYEGMRDIRGNAAWDTGGPGGGKTRTADSGGTETRPKNIAVNWIIKY
jgi:hypothetical protein